MKLLAKLLSIQTDSQIIALYGVSTVPKPESIIRLILFPFLVVIFVVVGIIIFFRKKRNNDS